MLVKTMVHSIARTSPNTTLCVYWPIYDERLGDGFGRIVSKAASIEVPEEIACCNVDRISGANKPEGPAIMIVADVKM